MITVEGVSSNVWWEGGNELYCHSREAWANSGAIPSRWEAKASQIKKIKNSIATREIVDPIDETVFQRV